MTTIINKTFIYYGNVNRVIDGDTADIDIDLGFNIWIKKQRCRFFGIDTAETNDHDPDFRWIGHLAEDAVNTILKVDRPVKIQSHDWGKYGRLLARIWTIDNPDISINQMLINEHLAVPYTGGSKLEVRSLHQKNIDLLKKLDV